MVEIDVNVMRKDEVLILCVGLGIIIVSILVAFHIEWSEGICLWWGHLHIKIHGFWTISTFISIAKFAANRGGVRSL